MPDNYLNHLDLEHHSVGNERRYEMLNEILSNGTFIPKTVEYKDIDEAFMQWLSSIKITSNDGTEFPTFSLFSNQRFSEYTQSWRHVDENQNLLLNFKTLSRENNPKFGDIQGGNWNIPGDRFYLMKKKIVLDDNGSESLLELRMRQPVAVNLIYKATLFTVDYRHINEFNTIINKLFASRQCYLCPNGHYMPMILDGIEDESQYSIDDRQFYSQSYSIKLLGYILTEDDFRVEEKPLKLALSVSGIKARAKKPKIEIEEYAYRKIELESKCGVKEVLIPYKTGKKMPIKIEEVENWSEYYYKPLIAIADVNGIKIKKEIPFDIAVVKTEIFGDERGVSISINGNTVNIEKPFMIREGDTVELKSKSDLVRIVMNGYDPNITLSINDSEDEAEEVIFN